MGTELDTHRFVKYDMLQSHGPASGNVRLAGVAAIGHHGAGQPAQNGLMVIQNRQEQGLVAGVTVFDA